MKFITKNALFSFLKNKTSIILLSVLVFLTSATFTLVTSVSSSFKNSYEEVVVESKLHDFISKEKYNLEGTLAFKYGVFDQNGSFEEIPKDANGNIQFEASANPSRKGISEVEVLTKDLSKHAFSSDLKYLYIKNIEKNFDIKSRGYAWGNDKSPKNAVGRIKLSDISIIDTNKDGVVDDISTASESIKVEFLSGKIKNGWTTPRADPNKPKTWNFKALQDLGKSMSSMKSNAENTRNFWISDNKLTLTNLVAPGAELLSEEHLIFKAKYGIYDFLDDLKNYINHEKLYVMKKQESFQVAIDENMNTGIYEELFNDKQSQQGVQVNQRIINFINENNLYNYIPVSDRNSGLAELDAKHSQLKSFIKNWAFDQKRENYIQLIDSKYGNKFDHLVTETINISGGNDNFKIVSSDSSDDRAFNKIHMYDGYKLPEKFDVDVLNKILIEKTKARYKNAVIQPNFNFDEIFDAKSKEKYQVKKGSLTQPDAYFTHASISNVKEYKATARWYKYTTAHGSGAFNFIQNFFAKATGNTLDHTAPMAESVTDPTSAFAVVSPSWVANNKNIKFMNPEMILSQNANDINSDLYKLINEPDVIFEKYKDSVIEVDQIKYFVTGSGVQPDFAFPIISPSNPIPDSKHEGILFTNKNGYLKANDAYRNNDHENYISFRHKDNLNISDSELNNILYDSPDSIEQISKDVMTWPPNIRIVSKAMDTSEQVVLSAQRVSFLSDLEKNINSISWITTTLLGFAVALFVIITIKKQINSRKKVLGILLANGYTKNQIAISNLVFSFLVVVIPSVIGYITGIALQFGLFNIFLDYWTLPIKQHFFSWVAMSLYAILPLAGVSALVFAVTRWEMRGSITKILNGSKSKIADSLSAKIVAPLKWMAIKNRVSLSIFVTNISKMLMILTVSSISIVLLSIGITTMGKFEYAAATSEKFTNYEFAVDLISPTKEGGLLRRETVKNFGDADWTSKTTDELYTEIFDFKKHADPHELQSTMMIPKEQDETNQESAYYLDNRIQFESILNAAIGGSNGANPWRDVAQALIPEGQRVTAKTSRIKFLAFGMTVPDNQNKYDKKEWYKDIQNSSLQLPKPENIVVNTMKKIKIDEGYMKFVISTLKYIFEDLENRSEYLPMFITYRSILTNEDDETYTTINGDARLKTIINTEEIKDINIIGLNKDTQAIDLKDSSFQKIENYKQVNNEIPIIVNQYFSEVYNKKLGDSLDLEIKNDSDRYIRISDGNPNNDKYIRTFKIVDVIETYNDVKMFTSQEYANEVLGFNQINTPNVTGTPFNGIFTNSKSPLILKSVPLYSQSGFYPSIDTLVKNSTHLLEIDKIIKNNEYQVNPNIKNSDDYVQYYSRSPYVMSWSNVDWADISKHTFEATLDLSHKLIYLIESLAIVVSILFIIIITNMLISDNKKFISTMRVMGYRNKEISRIFFKALLPSIIIAALVSIPVVFSTLIILKLSIISFGHILIPLNMKGWEIIASFSIVVIFSWLIYKSSTRVLKKNKVTAAFD